MQKLESKWKSLEKTPRKSQRKKYANGGPAIRKRETGRSKTCRASNILQNKCSLAKTGLDTAENELSKFGSLADDYSLLRLVVELINEYTLKFGGPITLNPD